MFKAFVAVITLALALAPVAFAGTASYTFSQTSSATKAFVRVAVATTRTAALGNTFAPSAFYNYSATKSRSFTVTGYAVEIRVDQDTKLYLGSDLTNYMLLKATTAPALYYIP